MFIKQKKSKLIFLRTSIFVVALMIGVSTLMNLSSSPVIAKEKIKLLMWRGTGGVQTEVEWQNHVFDQFMKKHPNIIIQVEEKHWQKFIQLLKIAGAGGYGPDFYKHWGGPALKTLAKTKVIRPLDNLFSKDFWDQFPNLYALSYEGKRYAVPASVFIYVNIWNKDLFKKAGLNPEIFPGTWDELLATCEKLKQSGISPISFADKEGYTSDWWIGAYSPQYFDSMTEMKKALVDGSYTDPRYLKTLIHVKELYDKGYFMKGGLAISMDLYQNQFLSEKTAIAQCLSNQYKEIYLKELGHDKVGVASLPQMGNGKLATSVPADTDGYYITTYSKHPKEVALLLQEMSNVENSNSYYLKTGGFPANKRWNTSLIKDLLLRKVLNSFNKSPVTNFYYAMTQEAWHEQLKLLGLYLQGYISAEEFGHRLDEAEE